MYLWLHMSALYSSSPAWGVLTGLYPSTHVQGECRQCVVISATTGQYIYIYKYKKQLQKIEKKVGMEYQKAIKQG